ncbi:MAG: hypothetical protein ACRDLN_12265, partial [Solirubrobacteraceae bacterium]
MTRGRRSVLALALCAALCAVLAAAAAAHTTGPAADPAEAAALGVAHAVQWKPQELAPRLTGFYVERGFLDAEVTAVERGGADDPVHYLAFTIREHGQARVTRRVFPCLTGEL